MRVLLVRPGRRKQAITLGEFMFSEPIGLECVYTVLKDKHELKVLDLMVGEEDFGAVMQEFKPQVVGLTSLCIDVLAVHELARKAKDINPQIITVVGGSQTILLPDSFFTADIDHVMEYTTEDNLKGLFSCLEKGESPPMIDGVRSKVYRYQSTGVPGINGYIIPDRECTARYRKHYSYFGYKPCAIMQTSRGCSAVCTFCLRWKIEGRRELDEPIGQVVEQIASIEENSIMIFDNNFLYNRARLEQFCDLLEARGITKNFICYGSAESIVQHPDTMARLRKNGLKAVLVGYETFSPAELKGYNKRASTEINIAASKILKELDIDCWASFILNPDWGEEDFKQFRSYIRVLRPEISTMSPLTPFPGSALYKKYQDRLIFSATDYDNWSFSLISVIPSRMSLRRYYYEVLK
ncbi:MAG TPA: radical SAM protein, partial [Verrucomicrobiae bacterium]|nr:radical SAM protein [Verrucomicrobiae bacterium]